MVGFLKMKKESYSSYILVAIDELLNIKSEDGDKFKITIEKLNQVKIIVYNRKVGK